VRLPARLSAARCVPALTETDITTTQHPTNAHGCPARRVKLHDATLHPVRMVKPRWLQDRQDKSAKSADKSGWVRWNTPPCRSKVRFQPAYPARHGAQRRSLSVPVRDRGDDTTPFAVHHSWREQTSRFPEAGRQGGQRPAPAAACPGLVKESSGYASRLLHDAHTVTGAACPGLPKGLYLCGRLTVGL
jgi:hypothetical protein